MPKAKQLSVLVEDRPGMLGEVVSALGAKKVNVIGFMAPAAEGRGTIRLVVDKPTAAKKVFAERGWETTEEDIVQVILADKPGALGSAASERARRESTLNMPTPDQPKAGKRSVPSLRWRMCRLP